MTKTTINLGPVPKCCGGPCVFGYAILICNSNGIEDDDFDVFLNGTQIGVHRARNGGSYTAGPRAGEFFRTDPAITRTPITCANCAPCDADPDLQFTLTNELCDICANSGDIIEQAVDPALFVVGDNALTMTITQSNCCGNYGRIWVLSFCKDEDDNIIVLDIPLSSTYGGTTTYSFSLPGAIREDCKCPPIGYTCTPNGCAGPSIGGLYSTQSECEAACFRSWECNYSLGCSQTNTYTNNPALTEAACIATCLRHWTCNIYAGCEQDEYFTQDNPPGSFTTKPECDVTCSAETYSCLNWSPVGEGCIRLYDGSGTYETSDCDDECLLRFECTFQYWSGEYFCSPLGYGTTGLTETECNDSCVAQSYMCDLNYGCIGRLDNTGSYTTRDECSTSGDCEYVYICNVNYGCETTYTYGSGMSFSECSDMCTIQSYNCTFYGCSARYGDDTGTYATQAACDDVCRPHYSCVLYYSYPYCAYAGYQVGGVSYATCCATEPCASSPYCTGIWAMTAAPESEQQQTALPQVDSAGVIAAGENTQLVLNPQWPSGAVPAMQYVRAEPLPPPPLALTLEQQDPTGPGTFLSKTLEKIGIKSSPTCSCKARARTMNDKGNDWCDENLDTIVGWLREEATKRKLPFVDFAGKLLVKRAIKLSRAAKAKALKECDEPNPPPASDS